MPPVVQITASPTTELSVSPGHGFRLNGPTAMMRGRISPVRRCLFGPPDAEEGQRYVERELKRLQDDKSKKWNFDFCNEKPLLGRYEWEPVDRCQDAADRAEQLPPPSCRSQHGIKRPIDEATPLPIASKWTRITSSISQPNQNPTHKQRLPTGQTKMTDFMKSSKMTESIVKQRMSDDPPSAPLPHFSHPVTDDSSIEMKKKPIADNE